VIVWQHCEAITGGRAYRATRTRDSQVVNLRWSGDEPPVSCFVQTTLGEYRMLVRLEALDSLSLVEWRCEYPSGLFAAGEILKGEAINLREVKKRYRLGRGDV
jgi:hypothetical protein